MTDKLSDSFDSLTITALEVKAQRDELLAACKALTGATEMLGNDRLRAARDKAFRAISRAEGRSS